LDRYRGSADLSNLAKMTRGSNVGLRGVGRRIVKREYIYAEEDGMICYLCGADELQQRQVGVRDNPRLILCECSRCGLLQLDSKSHISQGHYENAGMHGPSPQSIQRWLSESASEDRRRYKMVEGFVTNKKVADFGCGNGGFLNLVKGKAAKATGIELDARVKKYWSGNLDIVQDVASLESAKYDLVTAFHVIEHLKNPRRILEELRDILAEKGTLIIEVPNSEDALLTLYECRAFRKFTFWSQHLYYFSSSTLAMLAKQAGLRITAIQQYQRYPLSNHMHWLSRGEPRGHICWKFLDTPALEEAYARSLGAVGKCDTLIAWAKRDSDSSHGATD
jgi:2-polyprenyl-3-methyl-5-hydroxy-6-metoxy-1,4-benzoquinol methylase